MQGCRVVSFKAPSSLELSHDYVWRVHAQTPPKGYMTVFNRSHYEDVLIVRVKNLVGESVWDRRYDHINLFERLLSDEGTVIRKLFLHVSRDYQRERLQRRLDRPDRLWKFNPKDLEERTRWPDYMQAYEDCLSRCSTETAPWYVIPAEQRWYRNLLIAQALVKSLEALNLRHPEPDFDPATIARRVGGRGAAKKKRPRLHGTATKTLRCCCELRALGHHDRIDHVDNSIGGSDVGLGDLGAIDRQLIAFQGCDDGCAFQGLDVTILDVFCSLAAGNNVVGENRFELAGVLQQAIKRASR